MHAAGPCAPAHAWHVHLVGTGDNRRYLNGPPGGPSRRTFRVSELVAATWGDQADYQGPSRKPRTSKADPRPTPPGEHWRQIPQASDYEINRVGVVRCRTPGMNTYPGRIKRSSYKDKDQIDVILNGKHYRRADLVSAPFGNTDHMQPRSARKPRSE